MRIKEGRRLLGLGIGLLPFFSSLAYSGLTDEPRQDVSLEAMEQAIASDDASNHDVVFQVKQGGSNDAEASPGLPAGPAPLANVARWQIQVLNSRGEKVGFVQGQGRPPASPIRWNGLSPSGQVLPDGFYEARFVWFDGRGEPHKSPAVTIGFMTPPVLEEIRNRHVVVEYRREGLVLRITEVESFLPGQSEILSKAVPALRDIVRFLNEYSRNYVAVRGYTDSTGSAASNKGLSLRRAIAIRRYLTENGVSPDRLTYTGKGSSDPIASNKTPEGRAKNRRVEIIVLRRPA